MERKISVKNFLYMIIANLVVIIVVVSAAKIYRDVSYYIFSHRTILIIHTGTIQSIEDDIINFEPEDKTSAAAYSFAVNDAPVRDIYGNTVDKSELTIGDIIAVKNKEYSYTSALYQSNERLKDVKEVTILENN